MRWPTDWMVAIGRVGLLSRTPELRATKELVETVNEDQQYTTYLTVS